MTSINIAKFTYKASALWDFNSSMPRAHRTKPSAPTVRRLTDMLHAVLRAKCREAGPCEACSHRRGKSSPCPAHRGLKTPRLSTQPVPSNVVQPSQQATSFCSAFLICVKTLIFKSFKGFSILHSSKLRGKRQKLAKIVIVCSHRLILRRWLTRLYSGPLASASKCSDYRCIHHSGFIFSPFIQQVFLIIFQFMSDAFISWAPPVPEWSREEGHRGRQKMPTSAHAGEE